MKIKSLLKVCHNEIDEVNMYNENFDLISKMMPSKTKSIG